MTKMKLFAEFSRKHRKFAFGSLNRGKIQIE
jgi:hypothetical protein